MTTQNINQDDYNYLSMNYDWFQKNFPIAAQKACDEFFLENFKISLLGISKNINVLMNKESYFVTKIKIDNFRNIFFRASEDTISIILERILGHSSRRFNLNKMTDLEAKIITSFNDYLYNTIKDILTPAPPTVKKTNFDIIHLTFMLRNIDMDIAGKFIISIPEELLTPISITPSSEKFKNTDFPECTINSTIKIGTTKFSVFDLKSLDIDDIVVFENSNSKNLTLKFNNYEKKININPNLGLVLPVDNEEGEKMGTDNLWDSIEVEMDAQFNSVKITLGELKQIEEGMVVDLASIYDNKVTLSVENKAIAKGELVIINDRYGVKISEVIAKSNNKSMSQVQRENPQETENYSPEIEEDNYAPIVENSNEIAEPTHEGDDDEFDYSDFELEDEDI